MVWGGGWFEVVSMVGRGGRMVGKEEVMVETGWGGGSMFGGVFSKHGKSLIPFLQVTIDTSFKSWELLFCR